MQFNRSHAPGVNGLVIIGEAVETHRKSCDPGWCAWLGLKGAVRSFGRKCLRSNDCGTLPTFCSHPERHQHHQHDGALQLRVNVPAEHTLCRRDRIRRKSDSISNNAFHRNGFAKFFPAIPSKSEMRVPQSRRGLTVAVMCFSWLKSRLQDIYRIKDQTTNSIVF